MTKLTINKTKMFLPLASAKGTTEQRLQKARLLNLDFYKNLQDRFVKREVKPSAFKQELQNAAGAKLGIEVCKALPKDNIPFSHMISNASSSNNCKMDKYLFSLPYSILHDTISKSKAPMFLRETQKFFNEILNPKFLARQVALFNKAKDFKTPAKFYTENISGKNQFKAEQLNELLKGKAPKEQIDILQYLRYSLISEENVYCANFQIDKLIEKTDNMRFENKNYDLSAYNFESKKEILNKKLAEVIKNVRAENC